ncbi:MAG: lipoate--protein ligase [Lachnospiraceae bacterium]|nr:lipoate--protein ligase [Lachnospiraceae bacterium]
MKGCNDMIYMETGSTDPAYNLAFEEYVLNHRADGDYLLLWQNDNAVIIGQNQNTPEEINEAFVRAHGIKVVRRMTGGGAVYHDLGNLNYSFITDYNEDADVSIGRFTDAVVGALRSLGLDAESSGRNDILVGGKKISGTAQRISGHRILYHGTLLFDSDPEMIAGALHADPAKFASKSTKSVRSRVGGIRAALAGGPYAELDLAGFWQLIREKLSETGERDDSDLGGMAFRGHMPGSDLGTGRQSEEAEGHRDSSGAKPAAGECSRRLKVSCLSPEEESAVQKLRTEKYATWEWNYGRSPRFSYKNKKRFAGGSIEVGLNVEKGRITEAGIYGDFLSLKPTDELTTALTGVPYEREQVREALEGTDLRPYLGGITLEELLEVMFG